MPGAIHHAVIAVSDLQASLRFYRDGIGLDLLQDLTVDGDWPRLLGASSTRLRAVFLGRRDVPDVYAGVLELNEFPAGVDVAPRTAALGSGLFLLSFFVDVNATLSRLSELGLGGEPAIAEHDTPGGLLRMATVRDPDDTRILLTPGSLTRR